ncbi:DUF4124 domain-containing protein [Undibacterium sp. Ji83W]|uniref:DUF4124 domain-containing protein n=1 Tax=Undibacterium sp. Ji83W TaxID=3413043 RepID=UPI003BEFE144
MSILRISRLSSALLLSFAFCAVAHAQYVWIDEKGNKQFSDMPPPKSVPKDKILKAPGGNKVAPAPTADDKAASASQPAPKLEKVVTTTTKNEDFNKRRAEQAEKDKKAEEEKTAAADKAKNCERARNYQQSLNSGARLSRTDKNGERSILSDAERQQEASEVKKALTDCK